MRWLCCLLALLLWPSTSSAIRIDFDTLPGGAIPTESSPVGAWYASQGVIFGTLDANGERPPTFRRAGVPSNPDFHVQDGARVAGSPWGFHIVALFTTPVRSVSSDYYTAAGHGVRMTAFDANSAVIGVAESSFPIPLTLEDIGEITAVVWEASTDSFFASVEIDNLEFEPIPEPAAGMLLALGLGALALHARRSG